MYLIYALTDPRTGTVQYVGKSSSGLQRPRARHKGVCGRWQADLAALGLQISDAKIAWWKIRKAREEAARTAQLFDRRGQRLPRLPEKRIQKGTSGS